LDVARVEQQVRRVAFLDAEELELPSVGEGSVMATPAAAVAEAVLRLFVFVAIVVVAICVGIGFMRSMLLTFAFAEQKRWA
jgi:CBS domain containing-hemolysin-like protein